MLGGLGVIYNKHSFIKQLYGRFVSKAAGKNFS